jgi:hypothetical protein
MTEQERLDVMRSAMFVPCESKEALHRYIKIFFGFDLPNCTVDPDSNSNPMELIWEIYSRGMKKDPNLSRLLAYSAREGFKTLSAAVLEMLVILHMERNIAHMAAIEFQAQNSQKYVKDLMHRQLIRDFITKENERRIEFTRYKGPNGAIISPLEFAALSLGEQQHYTAHTNYIQIIIATLKATNSEHVPFFVQDELDLAPPGPLEEAKAIPTQGPNGEPSITFMTSTRKTITGPVQDEIDNADESGLEIRHWNLIDVTQACPAERHMPDLPKIKVYSSRDELKAVTPEEYQVFPEERKEKYKERDAYQGCIKNCRLFPVCEGRLATQQKSKSPLLKIISEVQNKIRSADHEFVKAQYMCWKPAREGSIYARLEPDIHMVTAAQMAQKLTGEVYDPSFSKMELVNLLKSRGADFFAGIDHGFSHYFAVATGARDGNRMFVIDVIAEAGLEVDQKVERCKERFNLLQISPVIYADTEDPGANKTLSRHFNVRPWNKTPGSVLEGIQTVRLKLNPVFSKEPELYFLRGDPHVEFLVKQLSRYHWKMDALERPTKDPDKTDDDLCDALRYLVMNVFGKSGRLVAAPSSQQPLPVAGQQPTPENWMSREIQKITGDQNQVDDTIIVSPGGKFFFGA